MRLGSGEEGLSGRNWREFCDGKVGGGEGEKLLLLGLIDLEIVSKVTNFLK